MTVSIIRWKDACAQEALGAETPVGASLTELCNTGFLLDENEEGVQIGMELGSSDAWPGRWRLTIPKNRIMERHDFKVGKGFTLRRDRKSHGKSVQKVSGVEGPGDGVSA